MRSGQPSAHAIGCAHVGGAQLRDDGAVEILDHRMDHALRMHDDLDALERRAEEPVRLDHLEALVHHRGRVDRDLAAHHPVGMRARLLGRHAREALERRGAERPARGGEQDAAHARALELARAPAGEAARQRLEDRRVLAVDRQQRRAALRPPPS
jgi:hypothetical protein